ncbi:MAG: hypothetical protein N2506_00675 [Dehalococcoidales bacterium]|nr:hypothetical protein [Dehalococcoidales bacterium]
MDRVRNAYESMMSRSMNGAHSVLTAFCEGLGLDRGLVLLYFRS